MKSNLIMITFALATFACSDKEATSAKESTSTSAETQSAQAKPYPLETCLVSGEELGSMGDPVVITHEGQEIKFCCDHCIPKFRENPEKYLSQLDAK